MIKWIGACLRLSCVGFYLQEIGYWRTKILNFKRKLYCNFGRIRNNYEGYNHRINKYGKWIVCVCVCVTLI